MEEAVQRFVADDLARADSPSSLRYRPLKGSSPHDARYDRFNDAQGKPRFRF